MTKAIPDGYHTITPSVSYRNARQAIEFYKNAFSATEKSVLPTPNGKGVAHAEIQIGNSIIMIGDEAPNGSCPSAETVGHATATFALYVPNADASFNQAVKAGAIVEKPMQDMFWGDRAGSVRDPFGYTWWILTHTRDVSPQEIMDSMKNAVKSEEVAAKN